MNYDSEPLDESLINSGRPPELPPPQSFILKVWLVEESSASATGWRGRITQIPTNEQIYVHNFVQIMWFIARHLERMGARLPVVWRLIQWWRNRWKTLA